MNLKVVCERLTGNDVDHIFGAKKITITLSHSNKLFARKFDENVDEEIINMLINKIKNESNS